MFAELIRRKFGGERVTTSDAAFESTTVSLSTAVPRPAERRTDERLSAMLRVGKLTDKAGNEQLIKVKNMSAGGVMAIVTRAPEIGEQVSVELSSQRIPSTVVWTRDDMVGLKFDQNVDLGELLAGRKPRHGFRPRPPRLDVSCKASLRVDKIYYGRIGGSGDRGLPGPAAPASAASTGSGTRLILSGSGGACARPEPAR